MENILYEISLAGLLHDIGKLGQRAFEHKEGLSKPAKDLENDICILDRNGNPSHFHSLHTCEFIDLVTSNFPPNLDKTSIWNLAIYHHRPGPGLQEIISEADILSSAMDRIEDETSSGHFRKVRLHPIINEVEVDDKRKDSRHWRHKMQEFKEVASVIFPDLESQEENQISGYNLLWNGLIEEWKSNQIPDAWKFINRALFILEKFTWCIPSATNVRPDISLFDHLKTTSAIAVCLYAAESKDLPFILTTGDFSGIQNYIYDLHPGAGGVARTLRGRSFKVGLFAESIALHILRQCECPLTHRIINAGSHFYLLLPNNKNTNEVLKSARITLDNWLLDNFNGEIRFNLAWTEISKAGLKEFPEAMKKIHRELDAQKARPLSNIIVTSNWQTEKFLSPELEMDDEKICKSCARRPGIVRDELEHKKPICDICWNDRETGEKLLRKNLISFLPADKNYPPKYSPFYNWSFNEKKWEIADYILQTGYMEEDKFPAKSAKLALALQRKALYVPRKDEGDIMEFEEIAGMAEGRPVLAYLKADVDDLGFIFAQGLRKEVKKEERSVSRIATLSRMLDYFFSAYLRQLVEEQFKHIYIVYAGGDDLVMIGPWNEIFDFALEMRGKFTEYTCGNQTWGLSAGIALANDKTPVLTAVNWAEAQLKMSKNRESKDNFTAFSETMNWQKARAAIACGNKVVEWLRQGTLSSGQIRRLFSYSLMYREYVNKKDTRQLRFIPQLIYDLKRNWEEKSEDQQKAKRWAFSLQDLEKEPIQQLYFICQYALNGARKSGKETENE